MKPTTDTPPLGKAWEEFKANNQGRLEAMTKEPQPALELPTEAMCDEARGFILGLDMGIRDFAAMEEHLDAGGYSCLPYIRENAARGKGHHITKWDVADCIWKLMDRARPVPVEPQPASETVEKCSEAVKNIFELSLIGPDSGLAPEDVAKAVISVMLRELGTVRDAAERIASVQSAGAIKIMVENASMRQDGKLILAALERMGVK